MTLSALGIFSAAGAGGAPAQTYELISTTVLSTTQSSITFNVSSFASTYRHLQVRYTARSANANNTRLIYFRFNGDTGTNYNWHYLGAFSDGSFKMFSEGANNIDYLTNGAIPGSIMTANVFTAGVTDILDAYSTTKNKTIRSFSGFMGGFGAFSQDVRLKSGAWRNTNALSSIEFLTQDGFVSGTRISLYGIRG